MHQLVIVDDEQLIVDGLKQSIDWEGFQINIALASNDPVFALNFILENDVHIVITDISMPTLNGLDLIQKIKSAKPSTYVIVLSSFSDFEYTKTALRSGAENYLLKPLDCDELSDTISQIINHIKERDELKDYYGYSLLTFRSAFTEQWVKNLISNNEFHSKAELLGINLSAKNYTVLIFSSKDKNASLMSKFLEVFLDEIIGIYSANFYFETPYRLMCVISPVENNKVDFNSFIDNLVSVINLQRFNIFISVGNSVDTFSKVPTSYQNANFVSYLEYSNLSHIFYSLSSFDFDKIVDYSLANYINVQEDNDSFIYNLFDNHAPFDCTLLIVCKVLNNICKNTSELSSKYPLVIDQISKFPFESDSREVFTNYCLNFLRSINELMVQKQQSTYPVVDSAIKMINNFADKDISLKTLSQKLNVTPSYLGTLFHRQTGYYFNDYLSEARLKYAAHLLIESDLKIKLIVDKIGFSSQTYFNRAFKRYYNTSPVNYRRDKSIEKLDDNVF